MAIGSPAPVVASKTANQKKLAARYLRYLLDRTDSERQAVAAWNQGLHSVQTNGITSAGGAYADSVLAIRDQRR